MSGGKKSVGHPVDVASGVMYTAQSDYIIPGKVPLTWERRYSTSLLTRPPGSLGPGWTSRYFGTLTFNAGEYHLVTAEGDVEVFADPGGIVEQGGALRHLATNMELRKEGDSYLATHWNNQADLVERYVFLGDRPGRVMPLASIEDLTGQGLDLTRDANGRLVEVRQRLEKRVMAIDYTGEQRIATVSMLLPDGKRERLCAYEYDRFGRLVTAIDARGLADRYEYDAAGRVTREIVKDGGVFSFQYDAQGRCTKTWGIDGYDLKTLRYRDNIGWTEVTNSHGHTTRYQWNALGQIVQEIDPLGGVRTSEYDEQGRMVAISDALGAKTEFAYDEQGNQKAVIDPLGATYQFEFNEWHQAVKLIDPNGGVWQREYDSARRLAATLDPLGMRCTYAYDAHGNLARVDCPAGTRVYTWSVQGVLQKATNWTGHAMTYRFDAYGRLAEMTDPLRRTMRMRYDAVGNLVRLDRADGSAVTLTYDAGGNVSSSTDGSGNTTRYQYGPCSRLLTTVAADGSRTRMEWGSEPGELLKVVNENDETYTYVYNAAGRIVRTIGFDGQTTSFEHDRAGQVVAFVNAAEERVTFERDANGRLLSMTLPGSEVLSYERDLMGWVIAAKGPQAELGFQRDAYGRIILEKQNGVTIHSRFDAVGNRIRLESTLGFQLQSSFDANGALASLDVAGSSIRFERNEIGQEVRRILSNGMEFHQEFDPRSGRLARQATRSGRAAVATRGAQLERSYEYTPSGIPLAIQDSRFGRLEYRLDAADRILEANWSDGRSERFAYDAASNLAAITSTSPAPLTGALRQAPPSSATLTYERGGRLQRRGGVEYEYDRQGRLVRKTEAPAGGVAREWSYRWNALDQLSAVQCPDGSTWTYQYDPLGRRIKKESEHGATRFIWDGNKVLHEQRGEDPADAWIFDPQSWTPLGKVHGGELHTVLADQLGTPQAMFNAQGELSWSARYSVWGEVQEAPCERTKCAPRFQGQWFDEETGLHYNRHRYYDPHAARFISTDPIALLGGVNQYAYVPNPACWIDPFGLVKAPIDLGSGWRGRVDRFNTSFGTDHEMHVYDPNGNEVGVHGSQGWFAKHGHDGSVPHDIPPNVKGTIKNIAIIEARRDGLIPPSGHADVSTPEKMAAVVAEAKKKKQEAADAAKAGCSGGGGK